MWACLCQLLPSSTNVRIAQALVNFDSKFDMSKLEVKPKKKKDTGDADAVEEEESEEEDIHGRGECDPAVAPCWVCRTADCPGTIWQCTRLFAELCCQLC